MRSLRPDVKWMATIGMAFAFVANAAGTEENFFAADTLATEESDWEIQKVETAKDRPGYLEITVRNKSAKPIELRRDWVTRDMVTANICLMELATFGNWVPTLIAEPCHGVPVKFLTVPAGTSTKAILPQVFDYEKHKLRLVLTQRDKKVVLRPFEETDFKPRK